MIHLKKHIALLLLGIFFFPILFQSIHIIEHHSHGLKHEHHVCHKKICDNNSITKHKEVSNTEKDCLICDYKFSINESPNIFFFTSVIPAIDYIFKGLDKQQQYKLFFSDKTPRAPPAKALVS